MMVRAAHLAVMVLLSVGWAQSVRAEALFDDATYHPLVADRKARHLGDTVTVIIFEASNASATTEEDAKRDTGANLSSAVELDLPKLPKGNKHVTGTLDMGSHFDGKGSLNRAGKMVARVSATIAELLPNGMLRISGKQRIELNNEIQQISIAGIVRPDDIEPDNTVLSTRIAEQELKYIGEGLLSTQDKPGIITRVIHWIF